MVLAPGVKKKTAESCREVDVGRRLGLPQAWGGREYSGEVESSQRSKFTAAFLPRPACFGLKTPGPSAEDARGCPGFDHTRK